MFLKEFLCASWSGPNAGPTAQNSRLSCHLLTTPQFQLLQTKQLRTRNCNSEIPVQTGLFLTTEPDPKPRDPRISPMVCLCPGRRALRAGHPNSSYLRPSELLLAHGGLQNGYSLTPWKTPAACPVREQDQEAGTAAGCTERWVPSPGDPALGH